MNPNQTNNGLPPLPTEFGGQPNPQPVPQPAVPVPAPTTPVAPQPIVPLAQNNNAAPLPVAGVTQPATQTMPALPVTPVEPPKPSVGVRASRASSEWNSTPWLVGIFFMIVLVAVLALVALNLYSKPLGGNTNTTSSSSAISSASSSTNAYGFVLTESTYNTATSNWSYQVDGNLPTPCHTATAEAIVAESMPEQVSINVTITPPAADTGCIQVIQTATITGNFSASSQAIVKLGTVTLAGSSN